MTEETRESFFDALAKGMASGTVSRGKALRLMGAALVGGTLASVPGIASAAPKLRPNGRKCKQSSQCVSGNCQRGVCGGCSPDTTQCNGNCVTSCTNGQIMDSNCACVDPTFTTCGSSQCPDGVCTNAANAQCNGQPSACLQTVDGEQACVAQCSDGSCSAESPNCPEGFTCVDNSLVPGSPFFQCLVNCNG